MTNQEKINEYTLTYPDFLERVFGYHVIHKIAHDILEASDAGKHYATLKFLQKYCTPVNVVQSNVSGFRYGDPRKFSDLKRVINDWEFVLARSGTCQ